MQSEGEEGEHRVIMHSVAANVYPARSVCSPRAAQPPQELYDKFMCYCKTSGGDLDKSIADAEAKIENADAALKEKTERKAQLEAELKEHTASRDEAKETMAQATALREKEASAYAKDASGRVVNRSRTLALAPSRAFLKDVSVLYIRWLVGRCWGRCWSRIIAGAALSASSIDIL